VALLFLNRELIYYILIILWGNLDQRCVRILYSVHNNINHCDIHFRVSPTALLVVCGIPPRSSESRYNGCLHFRPAVRIDVKTSLAIFKLIIRFCKLMWTLWSLHQTESTTGTPPPLLTKFYHFVSHWHLTSRSYSDISCRRAH